MTVQHAAVWMDHEEAKVFHIDPASFARSELQVVHHLRGPHRTGGHAELHRGADEEHPFFDNVIKHLADAQEILVAGPTDARLEFVTFAERHHKELAKKIVGVEPADHPTDEQFAAHVHTYFIAADRMQT
jgi:stalled ribosome rescue protein Dom34